MSRTLIVPDIHAAVEQAEAIIRGLGSGCDRVVLVGDYFDRFYDTPEDAAHVAKWLTKSVQDPRRVHLIGNHDMPYLGDGSAAEAYMCPGWTVEKYEAARPILQDLDLTTIQAVVDIDGWLVSHAGLHSAHLEDRTIGGLVVICREALARALRGSREPLFSSSRARGFGSLMGGVTWLDWSREFRPVSGWHQIVGHTPSRKVRAAFSSERSNGSWEFEREQVADEVRDRRGFSSMNWCIDTAMRSACIVEQDTIEIVWL